MGDFHKGDIGARLIVEIRESGSARDLSGATTLQLKYTPRKTGVTKTFTASYAAAPEGTGDGTDGKIEYVTTANTDLDQTGVYDVRAYIVDGSFDGHTQKATITVDAV